MRQLDFYRYDFFEDAEEFLFSLTLDNEKITASNPDGEEYLSNLEELYDLGVNLRDAQFYAEKRYEELFDLLEHTCRNPDFFVK